MTDSQGVIESARPGPVNVAVVQAAPVLFDTPRTLQKLVDLAAEAARKGAGVVVFPEAFVGGYQRCGQYVNRPLASPNSSWLRSVYRAVVFIDSGPRSWARASSS